MNRARFEYLVHRLKITIRNLPVFEDLLRLPYPEYKIIIEMMLEGKIHPDDFINSDGTINDLTVESAQKAIDNKSKKLSTEEVVNAIKKKNSGEEVKTIKVGFKYDHKGNIVDSETFDKMLPYLVTGKYLISDGSFDSIIPNRQQIREAGSVENAKKDIQLKLLKRRLTK